MKYLTGYIWRASQSCPEQQAVRQDTGLLLQHISYGKHNVVLAAICNGGMTGGYVTGGLKIWLANYGSRFFGRKWNSSVVGKELEKEVMRLLEEAGGCRDLGRKGKFPIELSGILIADQDCWILQNGKGSMFLLNRKLYKTRCRKIDGRWEGSVAVTEGSVERCVGILLGNSEFLQHSLEKTMAQCLTAQDVFREEQINNRLQELAEESRRQGYQGECSAIYIKSV